MKYKFIKKGYLKRACSGMMVIISLVLFVVPCLLYAQEPGDTLWTRTYGGSEDDQANCVQQTADGGYIIVGRTLSFGAGSYDVYLVKTDANGDTIWTRTYGGSEIDDGRFVQQTTDGGYIIVGKTQSLGAGSDDLYLIKTDANGDTLWTRTYGGENLDSGTSVQQTTDGGYVTSGSTRSYGAGRYDVYLLKTDADGDTPHNPNQLGERTYGGSSNDFGLSVRQTTDGGYIIAGKTSSFGAGSEDVYLVKVDSDGDTLWTRAYGGSNIDGGYSIQQTSDGNYIVVGSTASFGPGGQDIWLLKIDTNGDTLWAHTYGGSESSDYGGSVQQVTDGGYIIAGSYIEDLGAGQSDIYLLRTNSNGDTIWTRTYGGSDNESGNSCQQTDDGGYIIAGKTDSFGAGSQDVYLVRVAGQLPTGSISGVVTEVGSGVPIHGVYVEVFGTEVSDSTDINGEYALPDLYPGTYEVSFSHEVYRDTTVTGVEVISGEVTVLDVQTYIPLSPGTITGAVTDSATGSPIADVLVEAIGEDVGDTTDADGQYTLADLDPGAHDVSFSHIDYNDTVVTGVLVTSGEVTTLNVDMTPRPTLINIPADYPTIQAGIDSSFDGDTVLVQPGTYVENVNFNGHNVVLGSLFLTTGNPSYISSTIIDGNSSNWVVAFGNEEDTTTVITGFTIQNGYAPYGGGIVCGGSSPKIINNIITGNSASMIGGGIYCDDSSPTIMNNTISANQCSEGHEKGGGIAVLSSYAIIINNTISDNVALNSGGGIYCENYNLQNDSSTISHNTITGNSGYDGAGIWMRANTTVNNNIIHGNHAHPDLGEGGGILCGSSTSPMIANNIISENSAAWGGGMFCAGDTGTAIINNTITGNSASIRGGGLYYASSSNPTITNTIFWADSAPENTEIYSGALSLLITYCDIQDTLWPGEGNIDCDPMFCYPDTGNYYLHINSCCVGAGQDGVDIGAFGVGCGEDIPTLSEWGMVILALLLLAAGTIAVIRRGRFVTVNQ